MPARIRLFLLCVALLLAVGCHSVDVADETPDNGDDDSASDDDAADDDSADDDAGDLTVQDIVAKYAHMAEVVSASMDQAQYFYDDTWHEHFGDGLMYGPSFDLATHHITGSESHRERAIAALDTNQTMVADAAGSLSGLVDAFSNLESLAMAMLGLFESGQFEDNPDYIAAARALMNEVDALSELAGDYLPPNLGDFAGVTYGPTAITSLIALAHLGAVLGDPVTDPAHDIARVRQVINAIHAKAWDEEMSAYRFAPDDTRLMLYPNATMLDAYGRAYQVTGDVEYRQRMHRIYHGIQGLRAASGDHYYSPYSREEAGAIDEDYATLSSQNYLMIGLWYAYIATGDARYLRDIDLILGWIESHLFVDGVLKHHWVNGRAANSDDLYEFCSGCNLQTLYILRVMELATILPDDPGAKKQP